MKVNCWQPDQVIKLGIIQPAGCAVTLTRDIQATAASYAGNPGAQQYANTPTVIRTGVPGASPPGRRPNFLARFFGAK